MMTMHSEKSQSPITILLVDDHKVLADAIKAVLDTSGDIEVVGRVNSPTEVTHTIASLKPDIVLCDLEMPGGDPLEQASLGVEQSPSTKILILTAYPSDAHINRAIRIGVAGMLTKNEPVEAVVDGIRAVHSGHQIFSNDVRERLSLVKDASHAELKVLALTPRELSVVRLVAQGMTTVQIAEVIHRSPKTIDNQISSALAKTKSANRVELSRWAIREGLIKA